MYLSCKMQGILTNRVLNNVILSSNLKREVFDIDNTVYLQCIVK